MEKAIVTAEVTGNFHGKEPNPAFPLGVDDIANSVYESWNEGASIVHIHGRLENGSPTNEPIFFEAFTKKIGEKTNAGCVAAVSVLRSASNVGWWRRRESNPKNGNDNKWLSMTQNDLK